MECCVCEKNWFGRAARHALPDEFCGGEEHEEALDVVVDGGVEADRVRAACAWRLGLQAQGDRHTPKKANWVGNQADLPTLLFGRGPVRTFGKKRILLLLSVTYVDVDTVAGIPL